MLFQVTLFLVFEKSRELRGLVDDGSFLLVVKFGEGIAGHVAQTGELVNIENAYEDPLFNQYVDKMTGFITRSLVCCAIRDAYGRPVAVLQAVNRNGMAVCKWLQSNPTFQRCGIKLTGWSQKWRGSGQCFRAPDIPTTLHVADSWQQK
eukprot:gene28064-31167_t